MSLQARGFGAGLHNPCAGEVEGTEASLDLLASPASKVEVSIPKVDTQGRPLAFTHPHKKMQAHFTCHSCRVTGVVPKYLGGAGERTQWLRACSALGEDPSQFLTPILGGSEQHFIYIGLK